MLLKVFGWVLAAGMLGTVIWALAAGDSFNKTINSIYVNKKYPLWVILSSSVLIILYIAALIGFVPSPEKTWAGWIIILLFPLLAITKQIVKKKAANTGENKDWRKLAVSRVIFVPIFIVLAYFA